MNRKVYLAEILFTVIGLFFYSGATVGGLNFVLPLGPVNLLLRYALLAGSITLLGLRWRTTLYTIQKSVLIWLLLGLLFLSIFWSVNPQETFTQLRADLLPMMLFSLYFASRFSFDEQLQVVSMALSTGLLISIFCAVAVPIVGVHPAGSLFAGAWKGVYTEKNGFGAISVLTANILFIKAIFARKHFLRAWFPFGLAMLAVFRSTSKTALALSFVTLLIIFSIYHFKWQGKRTILISDILILIVGGAITYAISQFESVFGSLSGRTDIWTYALKRLDPDYFWLGFGKGAFFNTPSVMNLFRFEYQYIVNHAHNGYLEILIDIGFIGLVLFLICFILTYIRSFQLAYQSDRPSGLYPITVLNFLALQNLTESYLTYRANIIWVLFVTICLSVNKSTFIKSRL
jgi:exopolysaccharide production protein ExoQ